MGATGGVGDHPDLPWVGMGAGFRTEMGIHLPPSGRVVAYVHDDGHAYWDGTEFETERGGRTYKTLNAALNLCRGGDHHDTVICLPGYTEDVASADQMSNLKAGTQIIGYGQGSQQARLTWTAAAATFLLDVANVRIKGMHFDMGPSESGGVTVTTPFTVSAAGCGFMNCRFNFGDDADDNVGQAINTTAAADDFDFIGNRCFGATAAECETFLNLVGTDRVRIIGNYISGATSAVAVGLIRAETTAHADGLIYGNYIANNKALSQEALTLMDGCTGFMDKNNLAVLDNASVGLDNDGDYTYGNDNYLANLAGERGLQLGTVSA
jgi:hypothetical protein